MKMNASEKLKYQKSKYAVKKWESEFKKKSGRAPAKNDIKAAPIKIKDAYKTYWTLKTLSLENTLLDITLDENAKDSFNLSETNYSTLQNQSFPKVIGPDDSQCFKTISDITLDTSCNLSLSQNIEEPSTLTKESNSELSDHSVGLIAKHQEVFKEREIISSNEVPPTKETDIFETSVGLISKCHEAFKERAMLSSIKVPKTVWGEHLNKKIEEKKEKGKPKGCSISTLYAQKLFVGSKFNKRNPRKPREPQRSKTSENIPSEQSEDLPVATSFSQPDIGVKEVENKGGSLGSVLRQLDEEGNENRFDLLNEKMKVVIKSTPQTSYQGISVLQNTMQESTVSKPRSLNQGWVDRMCENQEPETNKRNSFDSGIDNQVSSSSKLDAFSDSNTETQNVIPVADPDDSGEDLIYDSDSESQNRSQSKIMLFNPNSRLSLIAPPLVKPLITSEPVKRKLDQTEDAEEAEIPFKKLKNEFTKRLRQGQSLIDLVDKMEDSISDKTVKTSKTKNQKKQDLLEKNVLSGKANENFVRINIQKKVFVRGKKKMTFSKYKKQKWKSMKGKFAGGEGGILKCFKCGDVGHFANACQKAKKESEDVYEFEEECQLPTLEEAEEMAKEGSAKAHVNRKKPIPVAEETEKCDLEELVPPEILKPHESVDSLLQLNPDGTLKETPEMVFEALREFGLEKFREGQEKAIMRVLSGLSTLVTLATGTGKSLCYQLPAYIYSKHSSCITLVVSPLVSLMEDQVFCGAECLKVACLHTNQTPKQREEVMEGLKNGNLSVLLVSPEALASGDKLASSFLRHIPPIAFACVDEAHCVSQWSHNFRPSYLTVCKVLREKLKVRTIIGLTATATQSTISSILEQFGLRKDDPDAVISDIPLPDNLFLSASSDRERDTALLTLLTSERFDSCDSIIVYCTRREQCEKTAVFLRTSLQKIPLDAKRKRLSLEAEAYHAGLTAGRRRQVQKAFMSGKLRIVVATVAFGMGINKNNIRAIIHYNMPSSFESYVQEVGRAGRDRKPAQCHVFLDSEGGDLAELRRHIYSNSVDRHTLRKLLELVFVKCKCGETCTKHEVAFPIEKTVTALDLPQENILTLLSYLELHEKKWIQVLSPSYITCKITSYKGAMHLKRTAKTCAPLAMAMALAVKSGESVECLTTFEFDVMQLARMIDWDSGIVKHTLKNLEWTTENGAPKKSGIVVELSNLGFRILTQGNLSPEELDDALDILHSNVKNHELTSLRQLQGLHNALQLVAHKTVNECTATVDLAKCDGLKADIRKYFRNKDGVDSIEIIQKELENEDEIAGTIRQLIGCYRDVNFTGRNIARILHGIGSPNFPPIIWGRNRFWRSCLKSDFNKLCQLATKQIILLR